jgi:hypothetical protein
MSTLNEDEIEEGFMALSSLLCSWDAFRRMRMDPRCLASDVQCDRISLEFLPQDFSDVRKQQMEATMSIHLPAYLVIGAGVFLMHTYESAAFRSLLVEFDPRLLHLSAIEYGWPQSIATIIFSNSSSVHTVTLGGLAYHRLGILGDMPALEHIFSNVRTLKLDAALFHTRLIDLLASKLSAVTLEELHVVDSFALEAEHLEMLRPLAGRIVWDGISDRPSNFYEPREVRSLNIL